MPKIRNIPSIEQGLYEAIRILKDVGIEGSDVGKIDLLDHVSYVGVKAECFNHVLTRLKGRMIKGKRRRVSEVWF